MIEEHNVELMILKKATTRKERKTIIKIIGNREDPFFKKILDSFEVAMSKEYEFCNNIRNMEGLSGRKFRVLLNYLIRSFHKPKYLEIG